MKKIFRLLLLGLLTATVLLPSVVNAEEQTVQEPSSSVYNEIDGIAPMSTPFIEEITLNNGESYELTKQCLIFPPRPGLSGTIVFFKLRSISKEREAFLIQPISTFPLYTDSERFYYESETSGFYLADSTYIPEEIEIHNAGIRITNFSSGPTTYRIGLNIVYRPDEADFELG